ncbi:CAP domain-containing protein [Streptomyces sp. NPDC012769]|uniref:CAP domain-containing protein n=1 Tax=Streptomyces sp. NPDC012769 TaxID=3364848 RepID=UPI0036B24214
MQHEEYDTARPPERPRERGGERAGHGDGGRRGPSFRTALTVAGTVAAAVTVTTAVYVVTSGTPAGAGTRSAVPRAAGTAAHYVTQVLTLANAERKRAGCDPLRSDPRLREAAQAHADDMAARGYYAHDSQNGQSAGDRITAAGYTWSAWGENIHRGTRSPAETVTEWMDSEAHRKNILNCEFKDVGVGVNLTGNGPWWVQDFATAR